MRTTYWHKLAIVIPGICAGFLLFAGVAIPAHADETCLRGGDGNCVELLRQTSLVSGTAKYFTGQASATNFLSLQDGSMVALVGRFVASYGANGVNTLNRYEIELQYSRDGGVTWEKPPITNKGHWYVDEHLPGSNSVEGSQPNGMDSGAGFLGFDVSSVYDSTTKKTYITLAHTIACPFSVTYNDGSITSFDEFNLNECSSPSEFAGDGTRTSGSVFIDTIVYDHTDYSFDQIGKTRSLTRSAATVPGLGGYSCSVGICYGGAWGADHPSIGTTMIGTELRMWVAYSAFRGGDCPTFTGTWDRCKDQNLADYADGVRYVKNFWVRQVKINQSTGDLSAVNTVTPTSDNVSLQRLPQSGAGTSYDANFFSSKIGVLLKQYPIIMYSYSNSSNSALYPLNWTYWNGSAWTASQKVQGTDPSTIIKNSYSGIQNIVGAITLASGEKISTVSGVASGKYSNYSGSDFDKHNVFHVAAYGTLASGAYVPVYIKFYMGTAGAISANPEALVLADSTNNDSLGVDANSTTGELLHVNANKGGPSIGWGKTYAYVAVPATSSDDNATTAIYTRIQAGSLPTNADVRDWSETVSLSWLVDSPPDKPHATIYSQPLNSSPTSSEGFSQPKLLNYLPQTIAAGGTPSPETLSNVFSAQMLFGRSQNNSAACSATNWCSVGYSGEYNTAGIRGWAWAEAIGWISLSCNNLNTCYNKSYDASDNPWTTKEGGFYYGVRAVTNANMSLHTLIGSAWSERAGYISFNRSTGVYSKNPCGNPPSGYVLTSVATNSECALLANDLSADSTDTNVYFIDVNGAAVTLKPGSFIVDSEVIHFTQNISGQPSGIRRGDNLANTTFKSVTTAHEAGTPVFWINNSDVTTSANGGVYDIYRGINSFDPSSYQLDGWARAESWATYQRDYCKNPLTSAIEIGSSYAAPCDKEWGWIKLSGNWSTVHRATVAATPAINSYELKATSVDGYPNPETTGQNELLYIPTLTSYLWSYSGLLTSGANSPGFNMASAFGTTRPGAGSVITWTATLTQAILADTDTITLSSVSGLLSSGKLRIRQDSSPSLANSEIIEYSGVDEATKTIEFVTRGVDDTTARVWETGVFIEQISETGTYNTFIIPMGDTQPERTLAGFGWSAPNTEAVTPDLTTSRYKDNIAGFGWVNFQPNQLEQIYPYLRTLFGNLYVGGDIEMVGPEYNNINPQQYTSTYQIQRNGSITEYIDEQQGVSSGQLQQCLLACNDVEECETECTLSFGSPDSSDITLDQGSTSTLGKIPDLDLISTMVSECQRWDSSSSAYVNALCSDSNGKQAWQLVDEVDINSLAQTGMNKYGQQVVVCRAAPDAVNPRSADVFSSNNFNPPECAWELSGGFTGSVSAPFSAGQLYVCMNGAQGLVSTSGKITFGNDEANMNTVTYTKLTTNVNCPSTDIELQLSTTSTKATDAGKTITEVVSNPFYKVNTNRSHPERSTVYVLPDMYGNEGAQGSFVFDNTPLQFNNASEGQSGAITFVIPGSVFFLNTPMRYCPQGLHEIPCKAFSDIAYDPEVNPNGIKVTDTNQIASVAWLINGSASNYDGYNDISFYPELKTYRVGAFIVMGDETEAWKPLGQAGTYWSIYMLNKNLQLNVYGLVMARHFILSGEYYVQDENENVVEPSENFIYDGRIVVNPPPGLEDLASGLPGISQAVP